jgi:triosephosphate isomerase
MRKNIVAGNWKMNMDLQSGLKLASEIINMSKDEVIGDTKIIIAPPFIHLTSIARLLDGAEHIHLAAQNCNDHDSGAYTGEVSVDMLVSTGVSHVIIGHSERREYFGETNEILKTKVDLSLEAGLVPIFCCGESLETRESGNHFEFVCNQLTESIFHLSESDFSKLVIAYEPIWAIGTGVTASSDQAQEMHAHIGS